jgi:hypothetical protein
MALQIIYDEIYKHKHKKTPILAIYIDLSKAYATKLLHKLKHDFNLTSDTLEFIASYFVNRQQTTHTQHAT